MLTRWFAARRARRAQLDIAAADYLREHGTSARRQAWMKSIELEQAGERHEARYWIELARRLQGTAK